MHKNKVISHYLRFEELAVGGVGVMGTIMYPEESDYPLFILSNFPIKEGAVVSCDIEITRVIRYHNGAPPFHCIARRKTRFDAKTR